MSPEEQLVQDRHYTAQWLLDARRSLPSTSKLAGFHAGGWDSMALRKATDSRDRRTLDQYRSVHELLVKKVWRKP